MKDRAQKVNENLVQERAKDKRHKEQLEKARVAESAPFHVRKDVWCDTCKHDYSALLRKQGNELMAYYLGKCSRGHTVRREITNPIDPFYTKSQRLRVERMMYADDLLTPSDDRFRHVYPDKWRELEADRERRESTRATPGGI